jgi:hypothetical protein
MTGSSSVRLLARKLRATVIAVAVVGVLAAAGVSAAITPDSATQSEAACIPQRCI